MSITHEKARELIQFKADRLLNASDLNLLNSHLASCPACAEYDGQINDVELNLRQAMQNHWNASPMPLQVQDVRRRNIPHGLAGILLPTRKALIGVMFILFAFTIWQFAKSGQGLPILLYEASPNPTPSLFMTGIQNTFEACNRIQHAVQEGDTLESIADQYLVPAEVIASLNDINNGEAGLGTQLVIPICTLTPTSTNRPPASTITPNIQIYTNTPG